MSLKPGQVDVIPLAANWAKNPNGKDYLGIPVKVFDTDGEEAGEILAQVWMTTDAGRERAFKTLKAIGWTGETNEDGSLVINTAKPVPALLKNDQYGLKVDWIGEAPFGATINKRDKLTKEEAGFLIEEARRAMGFDNPL
jgi:hypothetical protein